MGPPMIAAMIIIGRRLHADILRSPHEPMRTTTTTSQGAQGAPRAPPPFAV